MPDLEVRQLLDVRQPVEDLSSFIDFYDQLDDALAVAFVTGVATGDARHRILQLGLYEVWAIARLVTGQAAAITRELEFRWSRAIPGGFVIRQLEGAAVKGTAGTGTVVVSYRSATYRCFCQVGDQIMLQLSDVGVAGEVWALQTFVRQIRR